MRSKRDNLRFFEDMARIAGGAFQSMGDFREQIKSIVQTFLGEMNLVTRDEFERVEAMAQKARERQLELEKRLAALENSVRPASPKEKKAPAAKKPAPRTKTAGRTKK